MNCAGMIEDAKAAIIEALTDGEYSGYYCDLHNYLFNEDCHYCYTSEAEDDLNAIGVFDAIGVIVEYEKDNFCEVNTNFADPCNVANMLYYIVGEEVMYDLFDGCELWDEVRDDEATEETNKALVQWLKENGRIED
ncbi:MAG: hypothetical protein SPF70_10860 [Lachnospiraceae bacterium]|nr:hypothetical protein [Lachnospiraceae bacterium]